MQRTTAVCLTSLSIQLRQGGVFMSLASIVLKSAAVLANGAGDEVELLLGLPAAMARGALSSSRDSAVNKYARVRIWRPIKGANIITGSSGFKITAHYLGLTSAWRPMPGIIVQVARWLTPVN